MATEKRLIDANECYERAWDYTAFYHHVADMSILRDLLNDCPTEDAVEVVHGRWIGYHEADIGYDEYGVRCSNCNFEVEDHEVDFIMNYCPNCGAKMDGDWNG